MLAPPLGLRATRLADDAVFVDWSPPPFEVFAGEAEENESDLEEALSPRRLGYQVVWRAWDDTAASLLVAPPRAVTLADEEALERLAAPPCGEGEDEDAYSEEPASCFSAPLATSPRTALAQRAPTCAAAAPPLQSRQKRGCFRSRCKAGSRRWGWTQVGKVTGLPWTRC